MKTVFYVEKWVNGVKESSISSYSPSNSAYMIGYDPLAFEDEAIAAQIAFTKNEFANVNKEAGVEWKLIRVDTNQEEISLTEDYRRQFHSVVIESEDASVEIEE